MTIGLKELYKQINIAIPYLITRQAVLNIPKTLYDSLVENTKIFNELYEKTRDPDTATPSAFKNLHTIQATLTAQYHQMQQIVKHGIPAPTEEDIFKLFINVSPKTHRPKPAPTEIVKLDITKRDTKKVFIEATETPLPELNHKGLPKNADYINVFVALTKIDDPVPSADDYRFKSRETSSDFVLNFTDDEINSVAYIKALYGNNSGVGPDSIPIHTVILG